MTKSKSLTSAQKQVIDHILEYALGNFSKRLPVTDENDFYSGVAAGINMLGEHLQDFTEQISIKSKQEKHLSDIIKNSNDAIISTDLSGKILSWNPAAEKLYGYTETDLQGNHISILVTKEEHEKQKKVFSALSRGKSFERIRVKRKHKTGHILNVSMTAYPLFDQDGIIMGVSDISHDISHQLDAERNKELLLNIMNNAHEAIIRLNTDLRIESWNIGAQRIYGYSESEMLESGMMHLFPREEAKKIEKLNLDDFPESFRSCTVEELILILQDAHGKKLLNF